jgi:hypothetical protein
MRTWWRYAALLLMPLLAAACTAAPTVGGPTSSTSTIGEPIAWIDDPAPAPTAAPPTTPAAARSCTASDLPATATFIEANGLSQAYSYLAQLPNVGSSPCTIDSDPQLSSTDAQGRLLPIPMGPTIGIHAGGPATIAPGELATLLISISHACGGDTGPTVTYQGIVLVQAGKQISVPGLTLTGTCPTVEIGSWQPPQPDVVPPPLHYGTLLALVDAPATAHAGDRVDYVVSLTNPGPTAMPLQPCPVYRESLYKTTVTYLLNCPAGNLSPGATLRFAMRITVPSYTPAGHYHLAWSIVETGGESAPASAPIDIA